MVELNRAAAVAQAGSPEAGLHPVAAPRSNRSLRSNFSLDEENCIQGCRGRQGVAATNPAPGVSATAVTLKRDGVTLIDFNDLPPLSAHQVYELWLISGSGQAVPAAVFVPDDQGSKVVLLTRDLGDSEQLAVTVERGPDGASVPSQRPQLSGRLT